MEIIKNERVSKVWDEHNGPLTSLDFDSFSDPSFNWLTFITWSKCFCLFL